MRNMFSAYLSFKRETGVWQDQKYMELGRIVGDCCQAMEVPEKELKDCLLKLEELLRIIRRYESTGLQEEENVSKGFTGSYT